VLEVPGNGRCDEVRACLEKSWNEDGRLGGFVGQLCTFPMTIRALGGCRSSLVYGSGFHYCPGNGAWLPWSFLVVPYFGCAPVLVDVEGLILSDLYINSWSINSQ
jgi:hypothetical protein